MPERFPVASQIKIKLDGADVQHAVLSKIAEVTVDQHAFLPGMFVIRLNDPDLKLLDEGPFDLTKVVKIEAENSQGQAVVLIEGEITALEPEFGEGMIAELVVRGYDKTHRLFRETKSRAFLNKKDSDLASEIAGAAGLSAQVETTSTVYDHIYQHNLTDLEFLTQRAWRIGYECYAADGKLVFRKPKSGSSAITLTWGQNLESFQPRMTLAEQVDEVFVRGWDVQKKEPIVGRAASGALYPEIGERKNGKAWASTFGAGKKTIVDQPVVSQAEANTLAQARLNEISGVFVQATGSAFRSPEIQAGRIITIEGLGQRFSGKYVVTSAQHLYTNEGLATHFNVSSTRTGLLSEQMGSDSPLDRWPGVVTAVVTNTQDPKDWGRIKVKFPWMADDAESDWARLCAPGAGPKGGFLAMPEVGDEVLVSFEHGDFNRPIVLGGLWNGKDALPPKSDSAPPGEIPLVRTWTSPKGHRITVFDNADNKIEIVTAGGLSITLDDVSKDILINSENHLKITTKANLTVEATGNIELKATGNAAVKATGNLNLEASGQVVIKGAMVNIN